MGDMKMAYKIKSMIVLGYDPMYGLGLRFFMDCVNKCDGDAMHLVETMSATSDANLMS